MSKTTQQQAFNSMIKACWDEDTYGPLLYPNTSRKVPDDAQRTSVTIQYPQYGRTRESLGQPYLTISNGSLVFQIHLPVGDGTILASEIEDMLRSNFDGLTAIKTPDGDQISFQTVSGQQLGVRGTTYMAVVVCPFRVDEAVV